MTLVPTLFQAVIRLSGEVVVMHVGERPYVVTPAGQVDLATRELTVEAVVGIVNQLLPDELQRVLNEAGAVQYECPLGPEFVDERFTLVVAQEDGDIWAEIRRRKQVVEEPATIPAAQIVTGAAAVPESEPEAERAIPREAAADDDRDESSSPVPPPVVESSVSGLDQLLRLAVARGASTLYLSSASRPAVRVDGDICALEGAPLLGPDDVESLLRTLMPEPSAAALCTGVSSEWMCDLPGLGRVRCVGFRDHRGPGCVFRMPVRPVTVEHLGLSREIQGLAMEPGGLVLVAGLRASGKRTLVSALVDLINRTRHEHIVSIETEIDVVHEQLGSFISQREVGRGGGEMADAARSALREDPDVLVLEDLRTAPLMDVALEAASSGQLVIAGVTAHDVTGTIDRIIDLYPPELSRQIQRALAQSLRGVVAQVLLRSRDGARVAAREVLLNTPAVASALAEGRTSQLRLAIEGGRKAGMVPLNDVLAGYVRSGVVDIEEACRRSPDRAGFIALLKRLDVDTSAIERPA